LPAGTLVYLYLASSTYASLTPAHSYPLVSSAPSTSAADRCTLFLSAGSSLPSQLAVLLRAPHPQAPRASILQHPALHLHLLLRLF
jgi:hypothetical protein